ncbi:MAG TPA: ABC transporter ATP-binding protein, partial [Armatimonadota bacterium]|nr:ABC transporter ATP-binding protein [Armatimonadota bacterium]
MSPVAPGASGDGLLIAPAAPIVAVEHLAKRFGTIEAVRDVSFAVAPGEVFGLAGPDGAGKTTTMRILAGIMAPDGGSAVVAGIDVLRRPEAAKGQIGYLSQAFSMYSDLTVAENVAFFGDLYEVPRNTLAERREMLLRMTGLEPFQRRLAEHLSGGMRQKLALCCTLIHRPRVLLLDEPTTGVDPASRRDFWRLLLRFTREGVTLVVSTPYMDEVSRCDRVGLMYAGSVLALDTPDSLPATAGPVVEITSDHPLELQASLRQRSDVWAAEVFG